MSKQSGTARLASLLKRSAKLNADFNFSAMSDAVHPGDIRPTDRHPLVANNKRQGDDVMGVVVPTTRRADAAHPEEICPTDWHIRSWQITNGRGSGSSSQRDEEGFSLFTPLDRMRSKAGRERLRRWMAQPLWDVGENRQSTRGDGAIRLPEFRPSASLITEMTWRRVGSMDSILLKMQRCASRPQRLLEPGQHA